MADANAVMDSASGAVGTAVDSRRRRRGGALDGEAVVAQHHNFQDSSGRWQCRFCLNTVASRSYLIKNTRRDHEGYHECRGPIMATYLQGMSRWLCGCCFRSISNTKLTCDECQMVRDECEFDGDDPLIQQIPAVGSVGDSNPVDQQDSSMEVESCLLGVSLADVFSTDIKLLEHVPVKCRVRWATVLAAELELVASRNDMSAWTKFCMLTKCCLWVPPTSRGGKKARGKDALANIVNKRLESWQAGNYESLWNEALEHVRKSKAAPRRKATSAPPDQQVA